MAQNMSKHLPSLAPGKTRVEFVCFIGGEWSDLWTHGFRVDLKFCYWLEENLCNWWIILYFQIGHVTVYKKKLGIFALFALF